MTQTFRPDIEGLRGVAILLVVFYHVGLPGFTGGYVGVDVFFVLSGFLITGLLVKEIEETGRLRLGRFYGRRARRLLPALTLTVIVSCVASYFLLSPVAQTQIFYSALATVAYGSNIYFAKVATFYLSHASDNNPFLHTWTLSVEEQFYLAWPLFVLLALKRGRRLLTAAMLVVLISTLVLAIWLTRVKQPWAFFLSVPRAWEFAAGAICVLLIRETRFTGLLRWTGLAAIVAAAFLFTRVTAFPGKAALLPVAGTVMILHAGAATAGVGRFLSCAPLRLIGRLSYSWYLWHWPLLVFASSATGILSPGVRTACVLVSFALAWLTYHAIENPVRHNQYLAKRPARSLMMAACLALFGFTVALVWRAGLTRALASPEQRELARAATDRPEIYAAGCFEGFYDAAPRSCTFGEGKTVVLFGDSHAAQWFPALRELKGWRVVTFLKGSCTAVDVSYYYPTLSRRYTECEEWRTSVVNQIAALHPDAIVISSSRSYVPSLVPLPAWEAGTQRTLTKLLAFGASVYLIRDTPNSPIHATECLSKAAWNNWVDLRQCEFDRTTPLSENLREAEQRAAANTGARYLDLTEMICPDVRCQPRLHGQILFDEGNYLTATFVRSLSSVFEDAFGGTGEPRK